MCDALPLPLHRHPSSLPSLPFPCHVLHHICPLSLSYGPRAVPSLPCARFRHSPLPSYLSTEFPLLDLLPQDLGHATAHAASPTLVCYPLSDIGGASTPSQWVWRGRRCWCGLHQPAPHSQCKPQPSHHGYGALTTNPAHLSISPLLGLLGVYDGHWSLDSASVDETQGLTAGRAPQLIFSCHAAPPAMHLTSSTPDGMCALRFAYSAPARIHTHLLCYLSAQIVQRPIQYSLNHHHDHIVHVGLRLLATVDHPRKLPHPHRLIVPQLSIPNTQHWHTPWPSRSALELPNPRSSTTVLCTTSTKSAFMWSNYSPPDCAT